MLKAVSVNPYTKIDLFQARVDTLRHRFLKSFGATNIFVYNNDPRKKISSMTHTNKIAECLHKNKTDSDVYFYINNQRKIEDIKSFRACFCDLDAGRDSNGKYLPAKVVLEKKKEFLNQINSFPVSPTWVVDTRNGYQCYWILNDNSRRTLTNKSYWNGLQKKLANYFDSDVRALKPNQIYRVPYTWWNKKWEGKVPYFCTILEGSTGKPVSHIDLEQALVGIHTAISLDKVRHSSEHWFNKAAVDTTTKIEHKPLKGKIVVVTGTLTNYSRSQLEKAIKKAGGILKSSISRNTSYLIVGKAPGIVKINQAKRHRVKRLTEKGLLNLLNPPVIDNPVVVEDDIPSITTNNFNLESNDKNFLIKETINFLYQVKNPLWYSGNKFLSGASGQLAAKLSDVFCIG